MLLSSSCLWRFLVLRHSQEHFTQFVYAKDTIDTIHLLLRSELGYCLRSPCCCCLPAIDERNMIVLRGPSYLLVWRRFRCALGSLAVRSC